MSPQKRLRGIKDFSSVSNASSNSRSSIMTFLIVHKIYKVCAKLLQPVLKKDPPRRGFSILKDAFAAYLTSSLH